ncbi:MAG: acetylglutamate kinase [Deltaproteobacteria bacterium]|nr:acetylglutamate kinase [Deltaproteobacteria bacterium]
MQRVIGLIDAVPYLRAYHGQIFVVKVGGEVIQDERKLARVARDIAILHRLAIQLVVVHGGGPQLDALTEKLGMEVERVAGRRITSPEVLDAAKMLFRGQLSLDFVSALKAQDETAVGLSGADGSMIQAVKRPAAIIENDTGEMVQVDFGEVGDVCAVDTKVLLKTLEAGVIPVVSPLAMDEDGTILNCNADTLAAELAIALGAAKLILMSNIPGILANVDDSTSMLHYTDLAELSELEEKGAFSRGMRPKVAALRLALEGGVPRTHVIDSGRSGALLEEIFTNDGCGTLVVQSADDTRAEPVTMAAP